MSIKNKGSRVWYIPDGFIPEKSSGILESHEAICFLNCNEEEAKVYISVYFEDMEPLKNIGVIVLGQRTKHLRTDLLVKEEKKIPKGIPYALKVESDLPIIVQHSRMDSTQSENTLMTTIAYPGE